MTPRLEDETGRTLYKYLSRHLPKWDYSTYLEYLQVLKGLCGQSDQHKTAIIKGLTLRAGPPF